MSRMVTLEEVCISSSSNIAQKDLLSNNGEYPVYGASGLIKNVDFYKQEKPYLAVVKDGAGIGRVTLLPAKSSIIGTMQYILPKDTINISYLYYVLKELNLARYFTGATIPHIYFKDYKTEKIKLPYMTEQLKIADILDKVCKLITERKQQLEKIDLLVKSLFIEMFGDPVTNPMGWEIKLLGEHIEFLTSGSRGWSGYFADDGEMFITIKNVKNSKISIDNIQYVHAPATKEAERTRVKTGDLLISITADLGRTGVVEAEIAGYGAYINQHISLVRLDKARLNPYFVAHYLETEAGKVQFMSKNQEGVKAGLNFNAINSLTLFVPPIDRQNRYINFVRAADKSKFTIQQGLKTLELQYNALMQEYFG